MCQQFNNRMMHCINYNDQPTPHVSFFGPFDSERPTTVRTEVETWKNITETHKYSRFPIKLTQQDIPITRVPTKELNLNRNQWYAGRIVYSLQPNIHYITELSISAVYCTSIC